MAVGKPHGVLLVALGLALGAASLVAALKLQKHQGPGPDTAVGVAEGVQVKTLPPGDTAGRFEATVVATGKGTYSEYMVELMARASRDCADRRYSMDEATFGPDVETTAPAGEKLRLVFSCNHDRLPNHRVLAADDNSLMEADPPEGVSSKSGYMLLSGHRGDQRVTAEALLGGYLREVYTEQCEGKAVLVQYIATAYSPGTPSEDLPDPEAIQATMHYQCVDAASGTGG